MIYSPFARAGLGDLPASTATTYRAWADAVKSAGGYVAELPDYSHTLAAHFPMRVWVPQVNALAWPMPDAYSKDGQTAYYAAPAAVVAFVKANPLATATATESAAGAQNLLSQWFGGLQSTIGTIGTYAAIGGGGYLLFLFARNRLEAHRPARVNPPQRRRRLRRRSRGRR